jgi:hypothetical protein
LIDRTCSWSSFGTLTAGMCSPWLVIHRRGEYGPNSEYVWRSLHPASVGAQSAPRPVWTLRLPLPSTNLGTNHSLKRQPWVGRPGVKRVGIPREPDHHALGSHPQAATTLNALDQPPVLGDLERHHPSVVDQCLSSSMWLGQSPSSSSLVTLSPQPRIQQKVIQESCLHISR